MYNLNEGLSPAFSLYEIYDSERKNTDNISSFMMKLTNE